MSSVCFLIISLSLSLPEVYGRQRTLDDDLANDRYKDLVIVHDDTYPYPVQPLIPTAYMPSSAEERKRRLDEAFGDDMDIAQERTKRLHESANSKFKVYDDVLKTVGNGCGLCFYHGRLASHKDCPLIEDMDSYRRFKVQFQYPRGFQTCYKCHISAGGADQLHPPFEAKKECPNPYLVASLLYGLFQDKEAGGKAAAELMVSEAGHSWDTLDGVQKWLVDAKAGRQHPTSALALVAWLGTKI